MKINQPSVLIPDQCNNPLAYYTIRCLKEANKNFQINVIVPLGVNDDNYWLSFYQHSSYVDNLFYSQNEISSVAYLEEVIDIIKNLAIDIVFPASEGSFKFVSQYRNQLSNFCKVVVLPSYDALDTAFDKWRLYLFLKQHNIPIPDTVLLRETDNLSEFNYPVLIKPIDGSGGKNIQKFDSLAKAESLEVILNYPRDEYIIQKYIHGYDMGCSVLCRKGEIVAYTIQQQLGATRGFTPKIDKLKFIHDSVILDVVRRTMKALQWNGIANLDLRYNSQTGEILLLEINPRFWQSMMGSLSIGVNFPYLLYLLSNEISFEPVCYEDKYYAKFSRFIKDIFDGSLNYSLSDTNTKYFLSDLNGLIHFVLNRFMKKNAIKV
ncbi:ATP-utilizing enzyme (ATP-grasp superfamily) [Nostoc sp. T09]|uniref:ATP-grasp domain-containing protein n=1 Tax=Nostoc sp. T09 TaxID=1932621 RepID=UPI000A382C87|nr:ATP-grasp domain-containing protein [Nostoc sp. T09]OUL35996.1 ATP-utilizing enzyme (ATP-grasp superfamily) [Nostoc sp. T09]